MLLIHNDKGEAGMNKVWIMNRPSGFGQGINARYDYVTDRFTYDYHLFDIDGLNDMFATDETHRLMEVDDETLNDMFVFMRLAAKNPVEMAALGRYIGRHRDVEFWHRVKVFSLGQILALAYTADAIARNVDSGSIDRIFVEAKKEKAWWLEQFQDKLEAFVWVNAFNAARSELYPDDKKWEKKAFAAGEQAVKDLK